MKETGSAKKHKYLLSLLIMIMIFVTPIHLASCSSEPETSDTDYEEYSAEEQGGAIADDDSDASEHQIDQDHGSAVTLDGKVLLVTISTNDAQTSWDYDTNTDSNLIYKTLDDLEIATDYLSEQASHYGRDLSFIYDWRTYQDLFYYMLNLTLNL